MSFNLPTEEKGAKKKKRRFPWLAFVLLVATAVLFWGVPLMRGSSKPVQVEFVNGTK